jgi:hypothetical protein
MLTFSLNNQFLLLSQETSIRLTWHNPACFFESVPGDTGLGIDIPVNDHNRTYLGNPERFQKKIAASTREFKNFEIRYSGSLLLKGSLIIQKANAEAYSGWLRSDVGNLGKEHREKFIYDIAPFNTNISFVNKGNYDPLSDPYGCPTIFNPEFFYDKGRKLTLTRKVPNPEYVDLGWFKDLFKEQQPAYLEEPYETEALTEAFRITGLWQVNALNPDNTVQAQIGSAVSSRIQTDLPVNVVSPMLFLNFILKTLLADANFYIDKNFIADDPDLSKLILYSNFDISNLSFQLGSINYTFQFNNDLSIPFSYSNVVDYIVRNYSGTFKYKDLLPKIKLADFFLSVQNLLNVFFFFRMNSKVDIIDRESLFTEPYIDIQNFIVNEWTIEEQKNSTLKFTFDHDQNDTVFSEQWTDIEDFRADIIGTRETWDDLRYFINLKVGDIIYLTAHNVYVKYSWIQKVEVDKNNGQEIHTDTLGWEQVAIGYQNGFYKYGREEEETIETKFSTLMGDNPISYQRGNVNAMKYAYQSFSPRLLFYHGNNRASNKTDNLMLDWEKQDIGLLKKRFSKWNHFWANRLPVTCEADFPLNMLTHVLSNIYKRHRTQEGEFFIEKIETNFNLNSIGVSKITAFKI